jgi:phosphohistidine phosphatase
MKLYLMRHGQAAESCVDPTRGLTREGKADIKRIAHELAQKEIHIEKIFHSSKKRAQQTAEIVARIISPEIALQLHEHLKPTDDPKMLTPEINGWQKDTLIASHLPFLPSLADLLTKDLLAKDTSGINFTPGTVVCLHKTADSRWQLQWVIS